MMKLVAFVLLSALLGGCDMVTLSSDAKDQPVVVAAPASDFTSITGERYEKYYYALDPSIWDKQVSIGGSVLAYYEAEDTWFIQSYYNSITIHNMPLRAFFVDGTYALHCQGTSYHFGQTRDYYDTYRGIYASVFNTTKELVTNSAHLNSAYSEEVAILKTFENASSVFPKTGDYINTDHVSRYVTLNFTLTADQLWSFGQAPNPSLNQTLVTYYQSYCTNMPLSITVFEPFVHTSRNFYQYKSLTITFDPTLVIHQVFPALPTVVSSFDLSAENVLTVTFAEYNEPFEGPIFSYLVQNAGGGWEARTFSIE